MNSYASELIAGIKAEDEFATFREAFAKFKEQNQAYLVKIAENLSEIKKEFLKDVLQSHRVVLDQAEGTTQARKIVKVSGAKVANVKHDEF